MFRRCLRAIYPDDATGEARRSWHIFVPDPRDSDDVLQAAYPDPSVSENGKKRKDTKMKDRNAGSSSEDKKETTASNDLFSI